MKASNVKRFASWAALNAVFATAIFYGIGLGVEGAHRIAMFIAWVMIVLGAIAILPTLRDKTPRPPHPVPRWIRLPMDLAYLGAFVWHGAVITGALYFSVLLLLVCADMSKSDESEPIPTSDTGIPGTEET